VTEIQFVRPPDTGLLSAVWPRKSGLDEGETIPRISMRIGGVVAAELEAYREVCGFPSGPDLPLTFPQVAAAPLHMALFTHKVFPLPAMGLVHVSSEITQHHPIPGKAPMDVHVWVEGHRPARRGIEADLMTEVSVDGQVAWKSTTTVLSMAGKGDGVKRTGPEIPHRSGPSLRQGGGGSQPHPHVPLDRQALWLQAPHHPRHVAARPGCCRT
jgi:hypothetical protein